MNKRDVILESINEGVFTVTPDWRITSFNHAAERITGVSRKHAVGRSCCEVFRATICEKNCALRRTFAAGKPVINATASILNCAGRFVPIRLSTALLRDDAGKVVGGVETFQDLSEVDQLSKELRASYGFEDIVGRSSAMKRLYAILPLIADSDSTVLIEGPSGTGKELFARALHNLSPRRRERFVPVNCAALPDTLLVSELFGYKSGAFTDARKDKPGRFLLAHKGTLFLDEIGDISPAMQSRLLRVLQERVVEPLGGITPIRVDVRVIAATNKTLRELVDSGQFRQDLYYRIRVVHLQLPELRHRREDIPLLVEHALHRFSRLRGRDVPEVSDEAMVCLMNHDYPGNVRELENILEQACVLCRGRLIEREHLPLELCPPEQKQEKIIWPASLQAMERILIAQTLERRNGNRSLAARDLGINPSTLYRKIQGLGITPPHIDGRSRSNAPS
ncbi:MAG TPA: PAS domain-containing protein [Desulfonatronum sp.]|mgnify:CR=1 FL=1|nr:PAS domain-containing protein [Desulfonatronum sp.]